MPSSSVFIGIDVACAVGKRLPLCVVAADYPLMPLTIPKHLAGLIPRGVGNKEIIAAAPFEKSARGGRERNVRILEMTGWESRKADRRRCSCCAARKRLASLGRRTWTSWPVLLPNPNFDGSGTHW